MAKTTSAKCCLYRQAMYDTVTWCYSIKVSFSLVLSNTKRSKPSTEQKVFFSVDRSVTAGYDHVSYNYLLNFMSFGNALNAATTKTPWSVKKANEVGSISTVVRVVTKMCDINIGGFRWFFFLSWSSDIIKMEQFTPYAVWCLIVYVSRSTTPRLA